MWKVIVGGGLALVTGSLGAACSSGGVTPEGDAFPQEGVSDAPAFDSGTSEGGTDATDAGSDAPRDTTTGTDASDAGG